MKVLLLIFAVLSILLLLGLAWQSRKMLKQVVEENNKRPKQARERQIHPKLQQKTKDKK
ncbi:hypothetical protein I2F27_07110 [Acinetobacter sp. B5B]|uniref:hypothetical protein n=1 Tax=Acinetobacter baretiae TaxID=2605383 RepID=UPI0018C1D20C|nr:hypothetical protein [Acinetobacter baretiae]MBF7683094.1 hypothetical protein [Acinetobacter baretiae]MBF7684254.1 hypothetical protein [Acinetobacter baretiae]